MKAGRLHNKTVLVTAGPTYEKIDPVRYIGNFSSGKIGFDLSESLAAEGADVVLVAGPVQLKTENPAITRINVLSADEMYETCHLYFPKCDICIKAAAVADYKPAVTADEKIKKDGETMTLELVRTPDILSSLGKIKKAHQILVGFALETQNELQYAAKKMQNKNLDMIVLNSLRDEGAGFRHDTNKITILDKNGSIFEFGLKSKTETAADIINRIIAL